VLKVVVTKVVEPKVVVTKVVRVELKVKLLVVVDRAKHLVAVGKVDPVATRRAMVPVLPQILLPGSWPTIRMATVKLIRKSFRSECNAFSSGPTLIKMAPWIRLKSRKWWKVSVIGLVAVIGRHVLRMDNDQLDLSDRTTTRATWCSVV